MITLEQEDDIPLARIQVVVLEEENLVDSILLEPTELDEQSDGASQRAFYD